MNITSYYPWPVLGDGDAIAGVFSPVTEISLSSDVIKIGGNFNLNNKTIQKLIDNGEAAYTLQIMCTATNFRNCYLFSGSQFDVSLPSTDLRGVVSLEYFVTALKDIVDYLNDDAHLDYGTTRVDLSPGDILADGGSEKFDAKKRYAGTKNVSDFLEVLRDVNLYGPMNVSPEQDKIIVRLPSIDYDKIAAFSNSKSESYNSILHASLAFPALLIALQYAFEDQEYYQQFLWYSVLRERVEKENLDWSKENISIVAQAILKNPVERMLSGLKGITDEQEY